MDDNIKLLGKMKTDLKENSIWICYSYKKKISNIIVNSNCSENEILELIKVKTEDLINFNDLSPYLKLIVSECIQSDNEMWFVEFDDEYYINMNEATNGLFEEELKKEVKKLNLQDYITFNENDCFIRVYGGVAEVIAEDIY